VSSRVPLPASYGTHTPGRRTTRTVRLPKLLTPSRFSTSVGQTRRGPRVYCSPTTRSGLHSIHHSHIPRLVPVSHFAHLAICAEVFWQVGNAPLATAVLFRQRTQLFSASASPSSSCSLQDLRSFATLLVKADYSGRWIGPFFLFHIFLCALIDIDFFMHSPPTIPPPPQVAYPRTLHGLDSTYVILCKH